MGATSNHRTPRLIGLSSITPTPWRNGKGVTRELIAWPSADDWQLRFSVADIDHDGPFSAWPGVMRTFCVLDGAGVVLSWADGRKHRLQRGTPPLHFDGGDAPWAQLVEGSTRDLNLMTRGIDARLEPTDALARTQPWGCLAADAGRLDADGEAIDLPSLTLAWFADAPPASASFDRRGWWITRVTEDPREGPR